MNLKWHIAQALEQRWWGWYFSGKEPTTYLQWKQNYWLDFFQRFDLPLFPEGDLLEVGCGPAGAFLILPKENLTVLDPLLPVYRKNHPQFSEAALEGVQLISEPFEQWDPQTEFDYIYCFNVINHTAELDKCCEQLARCLKPGGRLYVSVDCHRFKFLNWLFKMIPGDVLHPQQHQSQHYISLLQSSGLRLLKTQLVKREPIFDYNLFIFEK